MLFITISASLLLHTQKDGNRSRKRLIRLHSRSLRLRHRKGFASLADKQGEIVTVVHVGDVEVVLRSLVWRAHLDGSEQRPHGLGRFQVEAVVADEAEYLAVAVDAVVPKHLPRRYLSCPATLLRDELHKVLAACRNNFEFTFMCEGTI